MSAEATVLIPTHEHGRLLRHAASSALDQTVSDIELFIVGDGVDEETRQAARELAEADPRVRFFDNPKGPRHGEVHRHAALQEASGEIVCYLSDDDIWLPRHVELMHAALIGADFAHTLPIAVLPDGSVVTWAGHLDVPSSRERVVAFQNFIPLSCGAHRLDFYRRLPHGWRTTPEDVHTDVYMWSQILGNDAVRAVSIDQVTVLHFASPYRTDMTMDDRIAELVSWSNRIAEPAFEDELTQVVLGDVTRHRTVVDERIRQLEEGWKDLESQVAALTTQLETSRAESSQLDTELQRLTEKHTQAIQSLAAARDTVDALRETGDQVTRDRDMMLGSLTWRARDRILKIPGLAATAKWVGRARARREATEDSEPSRPVR